MSGSSYYFFSTDGTILEEKNQRNGWGSSPAIWEYLCQKYIGPNALWLRDVPKFWAPEPERVHVTDDDDRFLLHMTYDGMLLARKDFERAAQIIERKLLPTIGPNQVNHWPNVVTWLREFADNEQVLGMGIYATSVSDNPWFKVDDQGELVFKDVLAAERVCYGSTK